MIRVIDLGQAQVQLLGEVVSLLPLEVIFGRGLPLQRPLLLRQLGRDRVQVLVEVPLVLLDEITVPPDLFESLEHVGRWGHETHLCLIGVELRHLVRQALGRLRLQE